MRRIKIPEYTEAQNQSMQKVHGWIVNEFRTTMRLII
jgi:hypothetical protein